MLALNDGRSELWQWDTGRTLAVDADCSQVHFSNKVFGRSIDVDVIDGAAIIPDILLQTDNDLNVWAFAGTAENGYTKISKTFKVNRRNKPADYVFTPEDQMTMQTIQRQIGDLADLTTEAKNNLVAAINEAAQSGGGGGSTVELDTTLTQSGKAADAKAVGDALAGKQNTISDLEAIRTGAAKGATALQSVPSTYRTASEQDTIDDGKVDKVTGKGLSSNDYTDAAKAKVDALAPVATSGSYNDLTNKPTIPTALPNPNALTFTGAVTGSYDGSAPLEVAIPSGGGGGTSEEFTLLAEVTLEEGVKKVTLPLSSPTKHFITYMWCPKTSATSDPTYLNVGINGSSGNLLYYLQGARLPSKDNKTQCTVEAHCLNDGNWAISAYANQGDAEGALGNYNQRATIPIGVKNNGIMQAESVVFDVVTNDATQYFPVGSILRVWGV